MENDLNNGGFANGRPVSNVAGVRSPNQLRRVASIASDNLVIESKAQRRAASRYKVNWHSIEAAAMLDLWERVHGREGIGGGIAAIVDWTGNAARWKARTYRRIEEAVKEGILERIENPSTGTGKRLLISEKGRRILEGYNRVYAEIIEELETKRVTKMLEKETKRLKREAIKAERLQSKGKTAGAPRFYRQSE